MRNSIWKTIAAVVVLAACSGGELTDAPQLISAITVSFASTTLTEGQTTHAYATLRDENGNSMTVSGNVVDWSSSDTTIATIEKTTGVVTAVSAGEATISASARGRKAGGRLVVTRGGANLVRSVGVSLATGSVNVGQTTQATAVATNDKGDTITNATITWSSSDANVAGVSTTGVVTGVNPGNAAITATINGTTGSSSVTVLPTSVVASLDVTLAAPTIKIGDVTQATATALDSKGGVVSGLTTTWATSDASIASVSPTGSVTGVAAGTATISATVDGRTASVPITVAATVTPPQASKLLISTQPSTTASAGAAFARQPVIQLVDASNSPVAQANVVVTATIASGGGTLSGTATATTDANGVATFSNLSIGGTAGTRTLRFSATSLTTATSANVSVTAGAASKLVVQTQPSTSAQSGTAFAAQPKVQVQDAWGNSVSQSGTTVTASVASGTGTLGGTVNATTSSGGLASFTNLSITGSGAHTLRFASTGLTAATSGTITVSSPAPTATQLVITTQPSALATLGVLLLQQPVVQLRDAAGNNVAQSGVTVTAAVGSGTGTLAGTTTATTNANGAATFTNLSIGGTAGTLTLSFSATGLTSARSNSITTSVATTGTTPDLAFSDFNDGSLGAFRTDGQTSATVSIVDDPTGAGRGKVAKFTYGGGSDDQNRWIFPSSSTFPKHFFFGANLYFPSNTPHLTDGQIQRKLLYFRTNGPEMPVTAGLITKMWGNSLAVEWVNGAEDIQQYGLATLSADVWHRLEVEVQINSAPSVSDGYFRIFVDGQQVYERLNWRAYAQDPGKSFYFPELGIGYQVENAASWSESRYWDNIGFATKRIP